MTEVELVMKYTGWDKKMAMAAIRAWRRVDRNWTSEHIAEQLEYEEEHGCTP